MINKGYVIPVLGKVQSVSLRNNKSSRTRPDFVRKEIDDLLAKGAIVECNRAPKVVNPLTVAEKEGKCRLVIDLRHINKRLVNTKCKFEDVRCFCYTKWKEKLRYFKFVVLPFELTTAGLVFTKVLREMIKMWRGRQIQAVAFLDDGLQANRTLEIARQHALNIKGTLFSAEWIPHKTKSKWEPSRVITWLGFIIDLIKGMILCTLKRIDKTKKLIGKALFWKTIHVKMLSKISGSITSMDRSHGELVFLFTKFMGIAIAEALTWNWNIKISEPVRKELQFWYENIEKENGMPIFIQAALGHLSFSDASDKECASVLMPAPSHEKLVVTRGFTDEEILTSSTEHELLRVLHGLSAFKGKLASKSISWFTDNKNVARIVKRGSIKLSLAYAVKVQSEALAESSIVVGRVFGQQSG